MDRLLEAMRRFSHEDVPQAPRAPMISRTRGEHASIISRPLSLTAVDAGLALIARRSNAALGVVKLALVRASHPGMDVSIERWVVSVDADERFEVSMASLDSDEERFALLERADAFGVAREPESGLDLARALIEREAQSSASGLVLADGSLQARFPEERAACAALGPHVLGVVKRPSSTRADAPESIASRFSEPVFAHRIDEAWHCRLHPSSKRIIRVEGSLDGSRFEHLLIASSDAALPGYPYALVLADRFARISNREARALALESAVRFGLDPDSLHDVLDSLEF